MASAFTNAKKQIDQIVAHLAPDYQQNTRQFKKAVEILKRPQRLLKKKLSVKMDNGKIKHFNAFRSQHNDARGPFKGGIRFHPNVSADEVMALSTWMSIKCSVVGIPYGGGKGGVVVNPKELSMNELERLSKEYARFIAPYIGPWKDVPAPDVNTDGRIMAWMLEAYEQKVSQHAAATFTGKPLELGGSLGRTEATGQGGFFVLQCYAKKQKLIPAKTRIAVQGFGNVGYYFTRFADAAGFRVVAASDSSGALFDNKGLDFERTAKLKEEYGSFKAASENVNVKFISNEELLALDVDILVPAALENAITEVNAMNIKAKVILEMANGPTTPEAEEILLPKKVDILPDVLCNAGGVTVSYFEWVQNLHGYRWDLRRVNEELKVIMDESFEEIFKVVKSKKTSYRKAAYLLAVKRIIDAMILRGRV